MIWDDRSVSRRLIWWLLVAAGLYAAVAGVTVAIVRGEPAYAHAGTSAFALFAQLTAGAGLLTAALFLAAHRPSRGFPALLVATSIAWPLTAWNSPGAGAAFTVGLVLSAAWPPLLAAAALRGPDERPFGRPTAVLLVVAAVISVGVMGLASAAVLDPQAQGCAGCPTNQLLAVSDTQTWHDVGRAGLVLTIAWTSAFAIFVAVRLARSPPTQRRLAAPVLLPAAAAVALFGADAVRSLGRGFLSNDPTDRRLWLAEIVAVAFVAAGVAWERVRARRTRTALARLVIDLGASASVGGLRERLAATLADPSLQLLYSRDDGDGWIDAEGRTAVPPTNPDRETTPIVAAGREIAAVIHRRGLLDDPALVEEIAAAARLALEHERLRASRRAHLSELRASRARIVSTADDERRRLEHDLHDGAQQRLVTLAIAVRLTRRRLPDDAPALDDELARAEQELQAAVGELRELAHGLFPAVLAAEGLGAALEALGEHAPGLVLGALAEARFATPLESAAYFLVAETLRLSPTGELAVDARVHKDRLILDVRAETEITGAPIRLEDRIGAAGGTLTARPRHLHAEFPCAS